MRNWTLPGGSRSDRSAKAVGRAASHVAIESLEPRRLLSALARDTSFGIDGRVSTDLNANGTSDDIVTAGAVQSNGKMLVIGNTKAASAVSWLVLRYNPDGSRDSTFGQNGLVTYFAGDRTQAQSVAVQDDGKVIVAGTIYHDSTASSEALVARYNPDGSPDTSFAANGVMNLGTGNADGILALSGGKILLSGVTSTTGQSTLTFWRFNADGSADLSFGQNGIAHYANTVAGPIFSPLALPDGSFLGTTPSGIAHFDAAGNHIATFGPASSSSNHQHLLALQSDGKILELSPGFNGQYQTVIVNRFNLNGTIDATFGVGGSRVVAISGHSVFTDALLLQPSGNIIVGATTLGTSVTPGNDFVLARLLPDGSFDDAFGFHGTWVESFRNATSAGFNDLLNDIVASPDGTRLYAMGYTTMQAPEDTGATTLLDNIAIASFATDVPLIVDAGGAYGPVDEGSTIAVDASLSTYPFAPIIKYEWDSDFSGELFDPIVSSSSPTAVVSAPDGP